MLIYCTVLVILEIEINKRIQLKNKQLKLQFYFSVRGQNLTQAKQIHQSKLKTKSLLFMQCLLQIRTCLVLGEATGLINYVGELWCLF